MYEDFTKGKKLNSTQNFSGYSLQQELENWKDEKQPSKPRRAVRNLKSKNTVVFHSFKFGKDSYEIGRRDTEVSMHLLKISKAPITLYRQNKSNDKLKLMKMKTRKYTDNMPTYHSVRFVEPVSPSTPRSSKSNLDTPDGTPFTKSHVKQQSSFHHIPEEKPVTSHKSKTKRHSSAIHHFNNSYMNDTKNQDQIKSLRKVIHSFKIIKAQRQYRNLK